MRWSPNWSHGPHGMDKESKAGIYRHIDKGHWPGDCRARNLHEGEGYLEMYRRSIWQIMSFASRQEKEDLRSF